MNARSAPAGRERSTDPPESQTAIREGEVHVWHGTLEASPDAVTPAEESRARRMGSPRRRREFLVARGALRRVLAGALGIDPLVVPLREGPHGKPHLVPRSARACRRSGSTCPTPATGSSSLSPSAWTRESMWS